MEYLIPNPWFLIQIFRYNSLMRARARILPQQTHLRNHGDDKSFVGSFRAVPRYYSRRWNAGKDKYYNSGIVWLQGIPASDYIQLSSRSPHPLRLPVHLGPCGDFVLPFYVDIRVILDSRHWMLSVTIEKAETGVVEIQQNCVFIASSTVHLANFCVYGGRFLRMFSPWAVQNR